MLVTELRVGLAELLDELLQPVPERLAEVQGAPVPVGARHHVAPRGLAALDALDQCALLGAELAVTQGVAEVLLGPLALLAELLALLGEAGAGPLRGQGDLHRLLAGPHHGRAQLGELGVVRLAHDGNPACAMSSTFDPELLLAATLPTRKTASSPFIMVAMI